MTEKKEPPRSFMQKRTEECPDCGKKLRDKEAVKQHLLMKHNKEE